MAGVIYREAADCGKTLASALKSQQPQDLWLTHTHTHTEDLWIKYTMSVPVPES